MIRIKLKDGTTVDTHLHTFEQALAAKDTGRDLLVGGPDDSRYGVEDELPGGTFDSRGANPRRTIAGGSIVAVEEAA